MMSQDLLDFGQKPLEERLWHGGVPPFFLGGTDTPAEDFEERLDTGFVRHARGLVAARPEDFGVMWEHYVLNEVNAQLPSVTPRYWRTKHDQEVDFVFDRRASGLLAVECKWSDASLGKLAGLKAFLGAYPGTEAAIGVPTLQREYTIGLGEHEATVTNLDGLIRRARIDSRPNNPI